MSLLFIDGFDLYGDPSQKQGIGAQMLSSEYVSADRSFASPNTRTGVGAALGITWVGGGYLLSRVRRAFVTSSSIVIGFALNFGPTTGDTFMTLLYDNLIGTVTPQLSLFVNDVAGISIVSGGALVGATAPNIIFPGSWNYIEFKVTAGKSGAVELHLNGQTVYIAEAVSTITSASAASFNIVEFTPVTSIGGTYQDMLVDDLYVCDLTGTAFNDFQGDCVVHGVLPAADVGPNSMSQFGGNIAGHYTSVNSVPPDDDGSYLYTAAGNVQESFSLAQLPADILEVLAVVIEARAKKDSAGVASYQIQGTLAGTTVSSPGYAVTTNYLTKRFVLPAKPNGGAWTNQDAQALHIGVETVPQQ